MFFPITMVLLRIGLLFFYYRRKTANSEPTTTVIPQFWPHYHCNTMVTAVIPTHSIYVLSQMINFTVLHRPDCICGYHWMLRHVCGVECTTSVCRCGPENQLSVFTSVYFTATCQKQLWRTSDTIRILVNSSDVGWSKAVGQLIKSVNWSVYLLNGFHHFDSEILKFLFHIIMTVAFNLYGCLIIIIIKIVLEAHKHIHTSKIK